MMYEELRKFQNNAEVRTYLNKMNKSGLVDYYFSNLQITATNKDRYMKKSKKDLVEMILNHYVNERRNEAMEHIKV